MRGIYKITNKVNNKVYIGESFDIERRWKMHIEDLNNNVHHSYKLQKDWNKYGKDNFIFEVEKDLTNIKIHKFDAEITLLIYECKYISKYNSIENGYNVEDTINEVYNGNKKLNTVFKNKSLKLIQKRIDFIFNILKENDGEYVYYKTKKQLKSEIKKESKNANINKIKDTKKVDKDKKSKKPKINKKVIKNKIDNKELVDMFINNNFDVLCNNYNYFNGFIKMYDFCKKVGISVSNIYKLFQDNGFMDENRKILKVNNYIKSEIHNGINSKGEEYSSFVTYISYDSIQLIKEIVKKHYEEYNLISIGFVKKYISTINNKYFKNKC